MLEAGETFDMTSAQKPLWVPEPIAATSSPMTQFMGYFNQREGLSCEDYPTLHAASISHRAAFWSAVWDFCGVIGEKGLIVLKDDKMPGAAFFPDAKLNFAENLMRRSDADLAMIFRSEDKVERRMTRNELGALVSRAQQWLLANGVTVGDRVAAMLPNMPESVALMLATASIGAIWSSCSPDFGPRGVLDRFGQIAPKVLITCDGYYYNGKTLSLSDKLAEIVPSLPSLTSILIVSLVGEADAVAEKLPKAQTLEAALAPFTAKTVTFSRQIGRASCRERV
jgi:acetoacetyl-CoA synthetase